MDHLDLEKRVTAVENSVKLAGINSKKVLNFEEAVLFTGFSESFLYKLTSGRKIPHYKPSGKMCYFDRNELESWLLQNRVSTEDETQEKALGYCLSNKKPG